MRVHVCRHCGETFEDYALLRRHVESHGTSSVDQPSNSTTSSSSDRTKTHVCETCGRLFRRRDSLLRHERTACNKQKKTYTCERCGRSFGDRYDLNRHARTACGDDVEPPLAKRSRWESTMTLPPFVEDPIEPPDRLVDHKDTCSERTCSDQVQLQIDHSRHDRSRGTFE